MDRLPSRAEILDWLAAHPSQSARRDIARAFGIRGDARVELGRLLRAMAADGEIDSEAGRKPRRDRDPAILPPVMVLEALAADAQGDVLARPAGWAGAGPPPRIRMLARPGDPALGPGDRILARLAPVEGDDHAYAARVIRRLEAAPRRILGVFRKTAEGGRIRPVDKGEDREWLVPRGMVQGARDGELVAAEPAGPGGIGGLGLPRARVTERLGDPSAPKAVSLIAIRQHGLRDDFPDAALAEAEAAEPPALGAREDLRHLPLVTIDPADARDHDDAVWAHPDESPANPGGHVLWVAIADVAAYVRPQSALDREARARGNSTYFPDRVVPMLPDRLSGDLCSLIEGADRPVIAVRISIDAGGRKTGHRFTRGLMRSRAALTYEAVQAARDGAPHPLRETVIAPLFAAYAALARARAERQPLDLDLPERRIVLGEDGRVLSVAFRERLEAHRLIEEFMVLANVAAAEEIERLRRPLLYRVHEAPSPDKIDALREVAQASGFTLAKGQVLRTVHLNRLLAQAAGTDFDELLNITTLRSMTQAYYAPRNLGHFGLALRSYAHFTSPIRRYSDLIVHRALIAGHGWGEDGLSRADIELLEATAQVISEAERRSMAAERDTTDRYLAAWLSDRIGAEFAGRISGVQRFGLFVRLDDSGADGLIPIRSVGREFFRYDPATQTLVGADSGLVLGPGQRVRVRLAEAVPLTGGLVLELLAVEDRALPAGRPVRAGVRAGPPRRGMSRRISRPRR
jgi:ribonuclease R